LPFVVLMTDGQPRVVTGVPGRDNATQEEAMMPYQSYQLWDTARARTASEQRAADERLGKLAAAISGSFSQARRTVRAAAALRSELGRSARLAGAGAAYMRAAGRHLPWGQAPNASQSY
jgi:hypothetical protein